MIHFNLEFPAHGRSDGDTTSLFQMIRAVGHVAARLGPVDAILAHSVGCAVAIEAIKAGLTPKAAVLIGSPARYRDYAQQFGRLAGLDEAGIAAMIAALRLLGVDVAVLDATATVAALTVAALLIHAEDDAVIPYAVGQEVANAWPGADFMGVSALGHHKILADAEVIQAAVGFIKTHAL